ncbi:hypothetical protein QBC47DRAFT_370315 [Echria macrotheca]|uniref:Uncharacterized protein n=1 Tax=Echria macrotheca TaxID=438768 RepID=A0AAJ0FAL7_9PEZI|nr:hypothetical protein QBC47DRAFT_370315 [Echria macrotheca]
MAGGRTTYAEGSCRLIGEGDLYGVGVRISYYLFFFATLLAIFRRTISSTTKTGPIGKCAEAINILTFAILIVLIRNTMDGSFATLEWFLTYPTILVTFISLCFALPRLDNAGILLCYALTLSLLTICQPWLYWRHIDQGRKPECPVYYWFFGVRNFYDNTWTTFFKTMSIIACIIGILFFFVALWLAFWMVGWRVLLHLADPDGHRGADANGANNGQLRQKGKRRWFVLRLVGIAVLFFAGIVTMLMTENTIAVNQIDLSDTPLGSTSQLIPFLTGLLSFLSTLYSCIPFLKIFDGCLRRGLGLGKPSTEYIAVGSVASGSRVNLHGNGSPGGFGSYKSSQNGSYNGRYGV